MKNNNNNNNPINRNNCDNLGTQFNQHQQQNQNYQPQNDNQRRKQHFTQGQSSMSTNQQIQPSARERSGQRNQGANQHPDSSVGRDNPNQHMHQQASGCIKFIPGYQTRDLPPIETKTDDHKKFSGRCSLFVGNLPYNNSADKTKAKLKSLFERFGEVGEVYLGTKKQDFAFVKMDTRQNAEAARDALDCSNYEGRSLRVRLAAHAGAIRVKHLSPQVTNELLAYAFRYFGEIERAVVVVDSKGRSIGEGIVEYSRIQSREYAFKRCQQECFMITASSKPVLVERYDQHDEDYGLPEKSINKNSNEYKEQRDVGPRFAEQGTWEHTFSLRWKKLYDVEKEKREHLEKEIEEARKTLLDQIHFSRLEHDEQKLRDRLQELQGDKLKYQQLKEQTVTDAQQREEERRQHAMMVRQQEEEIFRIQQLGDLTHESPTSRVIDSNDLNNQNSAIEQPDTTLSMTGGTMMPPMTTQQRNFADPAVMAINPGFMPLQQPMAIMSQPPPQQMNHPNMYSAFMPQQHQIPMNQDSNLMSYTMSGFGMQHMQQPQLQAQLPTQSLQRSSSNGPQRPSNKFNRQQSHSESSNTHLAGNGRNRKKARY